MTASHYVNLAMFAGEIMLKNGAESQRVEDTITRILIHYNFKNVETITTTTGMYISVINDDDVATTLIKRIHTRSIDLNKIAGVNSISRKITENKITPEQAQFELEKIANSVTYPNIVLILSWIIASSGFCYLLSQSFADAIATFVVGIFAGTFANQVAQKKLSRVAYTTTTSLLIGIMSITLFIFFPTINMDNVIIGGIMPLVPGVAFVNAIRDILTGDYLCAQARLLDVLLVCVCIAVGIGFSLKMFLFIQGGM